MIHYGNMLREARNQKHLSLKDVAEKTGITDSRLSRLEKNSDSGVWKDMKELGDLMHLYDMSPDFALSVMGYGDTSTLVSRIASLSDSDKEMVMGLISRLKSNVVEPRTVFRLGELFSGPGGLALNIPA